MRLTVPFLIALVLVAAFALAQQTPQQPVIANPDEAKPVPVAGAPDCATYALQHGDTKGSSSVTLVKLVSGCTVPMHWHSANEQVMIASGTAQLEMKGEQPHTLSSGAYFFMPAHHPHQLSCAGGCTFYRNVDGPVDIHYVDAAGNEIPAQTALAAFGERPAPAVAQK